jgi:hypothetical protein
MCAKDVKKCSHGSFGYFEDVKNLDKLKENIIYQLRNFIKRF